jgi:hypothetical protein
VADEELQQSSAELAGRLLQPEAGRIEETHGLVGRPFKARDHVAEVVRRAVDTVYEYDRDPPLVVRPNEQ